MEKVLEEKGVAAGNITRELLRQEIKALLLEVGLRRTRSTEPTPASSGPTHTYYSWGGKFHRLPKEFEFPSIDPLGAWIFWWFGDARRGYPPYKAISSDDLDTPKKKATLAEWSIMMRHISNAVEAQTGMSLPPIRDEPHAIELFNIGYHKLQLKPSKRKRRTNQLKLTRC
ncbi:hypothetical protein PHYSODRAFT_471963 [Phytophthora sojae]|uniref:Uncharacterized protein n=1 Tax=Phytophthora sojae (strain P6497) TaxID=1094619 RepID=G4YJ12_PHYSP|nr:hypothetical protein PHYSODRAFT_471963 [Phytophthora sojae]EGZ29152.1 hypothetical protein PHYSODRAFT_471963 [Phytophthora sojae]|eukprot:XP_009516427.1 hypothetical protein PHYSODRAFT_471963 [Phytophthora sojae]